MKKCQSNFRKIASLSSVSLFSVILLTSTSCSKHDDQAGGGESTGLSGIISAPKATLLDTVPADAVAVGYFDLSSAGYARLKASPYEAIAGKLQGLSSMQSLSAQKNAAGTDVGGLQAFMQGVMQLGLNANVPADKDAAKSGVYFLTVDAPQTPGAKPAAAVAFYCNAASGVDMKQKLSQLETYLESKGQTVTKNSNGGNDGFSIKFPNAGAQTAPFEIGDTVYAEASQDKLAFATSDALTAHFFGPAQQNGLSSTAAFKDALHYVSDTDATISTVYVNVKQLVQDFAGSVPEDQRAKLTAALTTLPIESVIGSADVDTQNTLKYSLYCPVHAQTDQQKQIVSQLGKAKAPVILKSSPADSLLFISLDSALIKAIKDSALMNADPEQQAQIRAQLAIVDQLNNVGIGIENASGASPFPEVYLLADSADPAATQGIIKAAATSAGGSSGMPTTKWQQKDVNGVKVDYMLSPLGVGLFLGSVGNTVFAASSEPMATSIIAAASGKGAGLNTVAKDISGASLFASYLDFGKLYQLIDSVRGTMQMFTGGKASFDTAQFDTLKTLGSGSTTITADAGVVKLASILRPPAAQ